MNQIKIHNIATGEIIEREMTEAESAQREASEIAAQALKIAETNKLLEKAALLIKLGITEDEAKLLLS
jgi:hypothetical protein